MRIFTRGDLLGRARGDDPPAQVAAFRAEVDDPVGRLHDFEIVLDHEHGVARLDESVQHLQQQFDVGEVQSRGRLVEQIEGAAGTFFDQFAGELHALRFAAGKRRRRLPELHVVQPDVVQRLQLCAIGVTFSKCRRAS